MPKTGMNIREATEQWVERDMNEIDSEIIQTLMEYEPEDWCEVTPPQVDDTVYVYHVAASGDGKIIDIVETNEDKIYEIELEDGRVIRVHSDEFDVIRDGGVPMWGTLWSLKDPYDVEWMNRGGIEKMAECGFKIYESQKFGYFFGIDGAGYSFYEAHWIPLYKARGLRWHEEN